MTEAASRISEPARAHPLGRALFRRMRELGITYDELEAASGVKRSTFKAYRHSNAPGTLSIQACLKVVRLQALPVPRIDMLPEALADDLKAIGERHGIAPPVAELVIVAASRRTEERQRA